MANPVAGLYVDLKAEVAGFRADLGKAAAAVGSFEQNINRRLQKVDQSFSALGTGLKAFGGAFAGAALVEGLRQVGSATVAAAQKIQLIDGTLRNLTGSSAGARAAFDDVYAAAQRVGVGVDEFAQGFARFARAGADLGRTRSEILKFTETIQKLAIVGGASTQEAASGALQLAQGLSAGVLQGDELRSILEAMPQVARAIASEFGVSVGELRKLGSEGALSADRVFAAIVKAAPQADREFAALGETVDQAKARFDNALTKFLADLDKAIGLSEALKKSLDVGAAVAEAGSRALAPRTIDDLFAERRRLEARIATPSPELAGIPADQRRFVPVPADIQQQVNAAKKRIAEIDQQLQKLFTDEDQARADGIRQSLDAWAAPVKRVLDLQREIDKQIAAINVKSAEAVRIAGIQSEVDQKAAEARVKARDAVLKSRSLDAPGAFDALRARSPEEAGQVDRLITAAADAAEAETRTLEATAERRRKAVEDLKAGLKEVTAQIDSYLARLADEQEAARQEILADTERTRARRDVFQAIDDEVATNDRLIAALRISTEEYEKQKAAIEALNNLKRAGIDPTEEDIGRANDQAERLGRQRAEIERLTEAERERTRVAADLTRVIGSSLEDAFTKGAKASDILRAALQDVLRIMLRMQLTKPLENLLTGQGGGSSGGGGAGGFLSAIGGLFGIGGYGGGTFGFGGGGVSSGFSSGFLGSTYAGIPGFATGGGFTVGGSGGVDSQLVAFRATPGEMVDITRPGADSGGGGITVNIDARGATRDAIPGIVAAVQKLRADMPQIAVSAVAAKQRRSTDFAKNFQV